MALVREARAPGQTIRVLLHLVVAAQVDHAREPDALEVRDVGVRELRERIRAEQTAPAHAPARLGRVAAEIAEVARACQRELALAHLDAPALRILDREHVAEARIEGPEQGVAPLAHDGHRAISGEHAERLLRRAGEMQDERVAVALEVPLAAGRFQESPRHRREIDGARANAPARGYRGSPMALHTIAIVGASLGGLRSAQALRRLGYAGRLIAIGAEPHAPYDRPPLSKEVLAGTWEPERTRLLRPEDDALAIEWRLGERASALDLAKREVALASGARVPFDGLVVATGSSARRLPGTPALPGIHVLRTLDDALALRAELERGPRVAVIGAGFIGAEVAATCRGRGLAVAMVEALPAPLERGLGRELGDFVGQIHRDHGVDLRCGVGVRRFLGTSRVEGLELADGARIAADVVLIGIGSAPNTDWLAGSGLELADGVVCDAALRAAGASAVVAVGDVARWPNPLFAESMRIEHWTNATEQADHAAASLLAGEGAAAPFAPVPFVWSDQYDRKIQIAGRIRGDDEKVLVEGSLAERRFAIAFGRGGRLTGAVGMNRPRAVLRLRGLIREGAALKDAASA